MNEKIEVGDVVQIKAGVQSRTVESLNGETATCIWEETDRDGLSKGLQRGEFILATLEKCR